MGLITHAGCLRQHAASCMARRLERWGAYVLFRLWPPHTPSSVSYLRCISLQLLACRVRCSQRDITRMASEIRLTREMDGITIQVRPVHRGRVPSSVGMSLAHHCSSNEKGTPLVQVPKPHETYMP